MRKRIYVLAILLAILSFCVYPTSSGEESTVLLDHAIRTKWYQFRWDDIGHIQICNPEDQVILSAIDYQAEYGELYNSTTPFLPEGAASITYAEKPSLSVGDSFEIRSESFTGRLNAPLVHQARVTAVHGNEVFFRPPLSQKMDRNLFTKRVQTRVGSWDDVQVDSRKTEDGWVITTIGTTPVSVVTTQYRIKENTPAIDITVKTAYKRDVRVFREAYTLHFRPPVSEVYRKNRVVDRWFLQPHYWLDREGAKFGRGNLSALLYHTPGVSSLELFPKQKQLVVNLDHMGDHRYVQQTVNSYVGKVRHPSEYKAAEEHTNAFSLVVGHEPQIMPRFMSQPNGYLATHVWTEHADEQSLALNRAIYFGSEKVSNADTAVGGFVKYRIPVTKSVFYSNPYYQEGGRSHVAIQQNKEFLAFLDHLHQRGHEIVLHTLYPFEFVHYQSTTDEALRFMKSRFGSKTWIDHGYLKASFAFDGLDIRTPHYLANHWEKYDTRYFWHYSSEDTANINDSLSLYQTEKGDSLRTPLYWAHPTVTGPFFSWAAAVVPEDTMDQYTGKHLFELIQNRGVLINHTYLARVPASERGGSFAIRDANGDWVINPAFDRLLQKMAVLRDHGDLYLTTVGDIMDYWINVSHVRIEYLPNAICLHNESGKKITGLSMAVRSSEVFVNGKKPPQKRAGGDLIFWFDLGPGESACIADNEADSKSPLPWDAQPVSVGTPH